jgi:hypothetical protein
MRYWCLGRALLFLAFSAGEVPVGRELEVLEGFSPLLGNLIPKDVSKRDDIGRSPPHPFLTILMVPKGEDQSRSFVCFIIRQVGSEAMKNKMEEVMRSNLRDGLKGEVKLAGNDLAITLVREDTEVEKLLAPLKEPIFTVYSEFLARKSGKLPFDVRAFEDELKKLQHDSSSLVKKLQEGYAREILPMRLEAQRENKDRFVLITNPLGEEQLLEVTQRLVLFLVPLVMGEPEPTGKASVQKFTSYNPELDDLYVGVTTMFDEEKNGLSEQALDYLIENRLDLPLLREKIFGYKGSEGASAIEVYKSAVDGRLCLNFKFKDKKPMSGEGSLLTDAPVTASSFPPLILKSDPELDKKGEALRDKVLKLEKEITEPYRHLPIFYQRSSPGKDAEKTSFGQPYTREYLSLEHLRDEMAKIMQEQRRYGVGPLFLQEAAWLVFNYSASDKETQRAAKKVIDSTIAEASLKENLGTAASKSGERVAGGGDLIEKYKARSRRMWDGIKKRLGLD